MNKEEALAHVNAPVPDYVNLDHIVPDLRALARPTAAFHMDPSNARKGHDLEAIAASLATYRQRTPIVVNIDQNGKIMKGNGTFQAAREILGWAYIAAVLVADDPTTAAGYAIADNRTSELSDWDYNVLVTTLEALPPEIPTGFDAEALQGLLDRMNANGEGLEGATGITLAERFLVPPFSVLDARQGYWRDRKAAWVKLLGDTEESREGTLGLSAAAAAFDTYRGKGPGTEGALNVTTSIFDPVLAELSYLWFSPPGGSILDPFAGEATKGIVAGYLGMPYTGVELRSDQIEANERQAELILGGGADAPGAGPQMRSKDTAANALAAEAIDLHNATSGQPMRTSWGQVSDTGAQLLEHVYSAAGEDLNIGKIVKTQPLAEAIDDGTMWVAYTGGKDSTAAALKAQELGFKPVLYHLRGINRAWSRELKYCKRGAERLGMPLVVDHVIISGDAAGYVEAPTKNQVIAALMVSRMAEMGGSHWTMGMHSTDAAAISQVGLNWSDTVESGQLWAAHLAERLPGLEHHQLLNGQIHSLAIIASYGLLDYVQGCNSPQRFQKMFHDKNVVKYGEAILPDRCGSCYKCWAEHLMLVALGAKPEHEAFRKHALKGMQRRIKEGKPAEWVGDPEEFYLLKSILDEYDGYDWGTPLSLSSDPISAPVRVRGLAAIYQATGAASKDPDSTCLPTWVLGDSAQLETLLPEGQEYDLIFTSPPYYDLEVYSASAGDGSAKPSYDEFLTWYGGIIAACVNRLKYGRFVVFKVGEIRDKKTGIYRNFVADTIKLMLEAGLNYYNEMILVTAVGSLPIRVGRAFKGSRKIGKTHQNILVFFKGEPEVISAVFPEDIEFDDLIGIDEQEDD